VYTIYGISVTLLALPISSDTAVDMCSLQQHDNEFAGAGNRHFSTKMITGKRIPSVLRFIKLLWGL